MVLGNKMMKIAIGFIFGVMVASAVGQTVSPQVYDGRVNTANVAGSVPVVAPVNFVNAGGVSPSGMMRMIQVDEDGYVICSDLKRP
jgi:hypothetical protein